MRAARHCVIGSAIITFLGIPGPTDAADRPFDGLFAPAAMVGSASTVERTSLADQVAAYDTAAVAQEEKHPEPQHTGFQALIRSTCADFAAFPRRTSTWVILGIGAGAAALSHPVDDEVNGHIVSSRAVGRFFAPGKWIGAAPTQVGVSVGLYVVGRYIVPHAEGAPRTNKYSHMGFDLIRAQILSQAFIHGIKYAVRRDRPTGECCSFPSGHAATAFAAASVVERHFGYRGSLPALLIASYVATSRLHDNRHFLSDVVFGSAIGVATGWTIVGRHGRNEFALMPVPVRGGVALSLIRVPADRAATGH